MTGLETIYMKMKQHYQRVDPHHETWMLWLKPNKPDNEFFEVAVGTILVQNTNWVNVDKAVANLKARSVLSFRTLLDVPDAELSELIRPAGFFNQKTSYLKSLANLMIAHPRSGDPPTRKVLLACKGVGNETADSILAYCYGVASPIVGTYTRRLFARLEGDPSYLQKPYKSIQAKISSQMPNDASALGHFHACIVSHSQNLCSKISPSCGSCFLQALCAFGSRTVEDKELGEIQSLIAPSKKNKASS